MGWLPLGAALGGTLQGFGDAFGVGLREYIRLERERITGLRDVLRPAFFFVVAAAIIHLLIEL